MFHYLPNVINTQKQSKKKSPNGGHSLGGGHYGPYDSATLP